MVLSNGEEGDNFVADLADRALQAMIRAKRGALPPDEPLSWTREPLVNLKPDRLRRLEGSYLVGAQLTTVRVEGDRLHIVRGARDLPLDAHSPTRFGRGGDLYEFLLDDRGRVREVRNHGDNGVSFLVPNDSPGEPAGRGRRSGHASSVATISALWRATKTCEVRIAYSTPFSDVVLDHGPLQLEVRQVHGNCRVECSQQAGSRPRPRHCRGARLGRGAKLTQRPRLTPRHGLPRRSGHPAIASRPPEVRGHHDARR